MKLACFFSLVACVAGFGFFDEVEDAPTVSTEQAPEPFVQKNRPKKSPREIVRIS
jgi:hypothetical protein